MTGNSFAYRDGWLHADDVDLNRLAAQVGTPCYVYSRDRMLANLARLRAAFPTAEIHYSLKANANLAVIETMLAAGIGLDAVSGGEIYRAIQAGADPSCIVFAGVGKTTAELSYALGIGVGWINVESTGELRRLIDLCKKLVKLPKVALRVNPDVMAATHRHIATGHAAAKFGIASDDAHLILSDPGALEAVHVAGIHLHIGSQLGNVERTAEAVRAVLPLFKAYPVLHTLNIGGGFPVSYTGDPVPPVEAFAEAVYALLKEHDIHLMLEPGRFIAADAGILIVEVQYVKPSPEGVVVITNGGMTELIRPALYDATHGVVPLAAPEGRLVKSHVVGPVCESADVLRANVMLPILRPGDRLAVLHTGAYGAVMGSTYNARPRPPEVLVEGDAWRIVRRRETWEDLIAYEKD